MALPWTGAVFRSKSSSTCANAEVSPALGAFAQVIVAFTSSLTEQVNAIVAVADRVESKRCTRHELGSRA
eukprot:scaffold468488_cov47-Prasinocladus_malaysianus.AAC.1